MSDAPKRIDNGRILWIAGASIVVLFFAAFLAFGPSDPIPRAGEIGSMRAVFLDQGERLEFIVPPEHWENLLDALKPCATDWNAAKWQGLGALQIGRRGPDLAIGLFDLPNDPKGAFAINGFLWRTYYRGGNSAALREALRKAHEAATTARFAEK